MNALFDYFFVQRLLHTFMDLPLDFAATKQSFAILGLTSNMFVNKQSDLLELVFLGLLSVNPSGVESIAESIGYYRGCHTIYSRRIHR